MKTNYIKLLAFVVTLLTLTTSCKKFLDVQPEDKILETQSFSTKKGINAVLNGLYLNLAKDALYGDNLTLSTVDILAQRYNVNLSHSLFTLSSYAYTSKPAIGKIDAIWTNAYTNILNINAFTENLSKYTGVLDATTDSIYRGEAIGMRALLHFDILRLFGPMYNSADSTIACIPYYAANSRGVQPLLPANEVMNLILADLAHAERLLKLDPVITNGVMPDLLSDGNDFLRNRNYRINYYAVKALQARVNMYRGNKAEALSAAKMLIQNADKFAWAGKPDNVNPDRIFSTEMIFGIRNSQLYNRYNSNFASDLDEPTILVPLSDRLSDTFESNENDIRYNLNWGIPTNGTKPYRVFLKYADVTDKSKSFRLTIPVMKISEMYYIAAECEPDAVQAVDYLNIVRNKRGLLSLPSTANLTAELQKEYQKEFFGEGQLFYFYKRHNLAKIPNGATETGDVSMTTATYVLPLPLSETEYRQ